MTAQRIERLKSIDPRTVDRASQCGGYQNDNHQKTMSATYCASGCSNRKSPVRRTPPIGSRQNQIHTKMSTFTPKGKQSGG